jgi:hypothetical protein
MRLTLVGADVEENLGMGMIAAAATGAGHRVEVLGFNEGAQLPELVNRITSNGPNLVGLAAQYQHRGLGFLALATALRKAGFRGHITAGGHFATMGCAEVLAGRYGVDSVVLYDGEETIVDLPLSIHWQSDGEVVGADRQVTWAPSSDDDQLNVAVRSRDGVAVAELRLCQVRGRRG